MRLELPADELIRFQWTVLRLERLTDSVNFMYLMPVKPQSNYDQIANGEYLLQQIQTKYDENYTSSHIGLLSLNAPLSTSHIFKQFWLTWKWKPWFARTSRMCRDWQSNTTRLPWRWPHGSWWRLHTVTDRRTTGIFDLFVQLFILPVLWTK